MTDISPNATDLPSPAPVIIAQVAPDLPQVGQLIRFLDEYQGSLYPKESNHLDSIETLKHPGVTMLGAWDGEMLAGIGALKSMDGYGEIKRMVVPQACRQKGIAGQLLSALTARAAAMGLPRLCLETGIYQEAAIRLYEKNGFCRTGSFGDYTADPLSLFMEKALPSRTDALSIAPFDLGQKEAKTREVIRLWQDCGLTRPWNDPARDIRRKLAEAPALFFTARLCGQMAGTCMAGYDGHRGWFYYLGVAPAFRHLGIAKELVTRAEAALLKRGCPKINLMVRSDNDQARGFYRGLGYADDAVVVMGKRLIPDL